VLRLVIDGGTPLVKSELSGIEDVTLQMMLRGSKKYPYSEIQKIVYNESASFSSAAGKDYSTVGFRCIVKSLDAIYPVFADSILNPLFNEGDFKTVMTEVNESVQASLSDPSKLLVSTLQKKAYADHPYASSEDATEETIKNITLAAVKAQYGELLNASRLSFVIVGNFDADKIKLFTSQLESSFGSIPKMEYERPSVPLLAVSGETVYEPCKTAGETGYAAGYFVCPNRTDKDYVPFAIATMYLDDILFAKVREEHGAVYTIGTGIIPGRISLGIISVYKATEKENLSSYINEAVGSFPDEKGIEEKLEQYKNKYITTLFETSQNAAGVASNITSSIEYYADPQSYLNRASQVRAVTSAQVLAAYKKYLARSADKAEGGIVNPIRWVVVSGADTVKAFKF
jgi:zinc protease